MPDDDLDPAANTQMFQAFVDRREPDTSGSHGRMALILAVVGLVIVVAVAWLLVSH